LPALGAGSAGGLSWPEAGGDAADRIEYRFHGRHLLLVDRHTRQVIDILDDALGR
jgi:hypothetical protein